MIVLANLLKLMDMVTRIGTLRETSLHSSLKQLYARPGDLLEAKIGNSIIDIVRGELLIEIQTGNFSALRSKLTSHLHARPIRIIYPIAVKKSVMRIAIDGDKISSRKSPKTGRIELLFGELFRIAGYAKHPNFSLEVALIDEEVVLVNDGLGSWRRRGWSVEDRRMIRFIDRVVFEKPMDYLALLPGGLDEYFTSLDIAKGLHIRQSLANKMIYSLRGMEMIKQVGKSGRYNLYAKK